MIIKFNVSDTAASIMQIVSCNFLEFRKSTEMSHTQYSISKFTQTEYSIKQRIQTMSDTTICPLRGRCQEMCSMQLNFPGVCPHYSFGAHLRFQKKNVLYIYVSFLSYYYFFLHKHKI